MENIHFFFTPNPLKGAQAPNLVRVGMRLKSPLGDPIAIGLGVNQIGNMKSKTAKNFKIKNEKIFSDFNKCHSV
jgi:hypothetical protein